MQPNDAAPTVPTDVAFVHLTELGYVSDTLEVSSEKTRPMNEIKIQLHGSVHDHAAGKPNDTRKCHFGHLTPVTY